MISTNDLRSGIIIDMDGVLYLIVSAQHVKPGKGSAFVRVKMKRLSDGSTLEQTFRAGEKVQRAFVETKQMQYLYNDGEHYVFMDMATYEQVTLAGDIIEDVRLWLKEGMTVNVQFYQGKAVGVEVPTFVELAVVETEPGVRGDTAQGGSKPAKLETGAVVQVPLFVTEGDIVRVDTRTGEYVERIG
ncbi:elongation factor P [Coprothermobacteraceae bacterium]|nr:elongation factor P [Coprothermobacteraceae bacterium]